MEKKRNIKDLLMAVMLKHEIERARQEVLARFSHRF